MSNLDKSNTKKLNKKSSFSSLFSKKKNPISEPYSDLFPAKNELTSDGTTVSMKMTKASSELEELYNKAVLAVSDADHAKDSPTYYESEKEAATEAVRLCEKKFEDTIKVLKDHQHLMKQFEFCWKKQLDGLSEKLKNLPENAIE